MDTNSRQLIDAQFDRAVEIVQGLPKTGPIQTGYEDKLNMYRYAISLLLQHTASNKAYAVAAFTNKVSTIVHFSVK